MQFTLVTTVFNEIRRLDDTISDIMDQSVLPSEIVITDAGSTDGTYEKLLEWKAKSKIALKIIQDKGCNVARGRNLAIAEATYDLIVSTDFGCRFASDWLKNLIRPFSDPDLEVVGGAFSVNETEIETLAGRSDYILQRGYKIRMDANFSVSSRSIAYKKYVWEKLGGYPEWLTLAADDTIFWKLIKKAGYRYVFVESADVFWGRHKTNRAFAREAFRYGLGDGESRINYRNFWSNLIETGVRYLFYLSLILDVSMFLTFKERGQIPMILWLLPVILIPGLRSYFYAFRNWKYLKSSRYNFIAFVNALIQLELSRWQYLRGYLKGLSDGDPVKAEGRKKLWNTLLQNS